MKKCFMYLLLSAAILLSGGLASCTKSNDTLIKEYKEVCKEVVEAIKKGDREKLITLTEKGQKIEKELNERELTPEQKEEVEKITIELMHDTTEASLDMLQSAKDALDL